jgi:hypothetical protein
VETGTHLGHSSDSQGNHFGPRSPSLLKRMIPRPPTCYKHVTAAAPLCAFTPLMIKTSSDKGTVLTCFAVYEVVWDGVPTPAVMSTCLATSGVEGYVFHNPCTSTTTTNRFLGSHELMKFPLSGDEIVSTDSYCVLIWEMREYSHTTNAHIGRTKENTCPPHCAFRHSVCSLLRVCERPLIHSLDTLNPTMVIDLSTSNEVPDTVVTKSPLLLPHEHSQPTTSTPRMSVTVHKYDTSVIPWLERKL